MSFWCLQLSDLAFSLMKVLSKELKMDDGHNELDQLNLFKSNLRMLDHFLLQSLYIMFFWYINLLNYSQFAGIRN